MIYFDNSATTAIHPLVLDTYVQTSRRILGNPSSLHHLGSQATRLLNQSRQQIAELLGVSSEEIYFTSGGTEGNNWVIKGTALEKKGFGKHLIISSIEHAAVYKAAYQLESLGFEVSIAPVDSQGFIDVEALSQLIRPDTILVSTMVVNNEVGSIQPIKEIGELLKAYPTIHYHVDAVQALGKLPISSWLVDRVDFATFSSHKFHGPKGTGFIFWRKGRKIQPLLNGGGQESGQRSGTENVPGVVATARATRLQLEEVADKIARQGQIQAYLIDALSQYERVVLFSQASANYAPHIICFGIKGIKGEVLVHALEEKEVIISTTSACSSRSHQEGGTLKAMGVPTELGTSAVRASLNSQTTMAEAEQFMITFNHVYQKFQQLFID